MKILGVTQGESIRVFLRLMDLLYDMVPELTPAAYVSDALAFKAVEKRERKLADGSMALLREWDLTGKGKESIPDWTYLRQVESSLGDPVLWHALLADRRIFFGRACKFRQDYRPRFSYRQMGGILTEGIRAIDEFLDRVKPDVILGFGTATFGDYLFFRFAKSRGIPFLLLKSTKIANYVSLNDDAVLLSSHVARYWSGLDALPDNALEVAKAHIARIREKGVKYEGALKSSARLRPIYGAVAVLRGGVRDALNWQDRDIWRDNHVDSAMAHGWHVNIQQPLRAAYVGWRLKRHWVRAEEIGKLPPFAFFPLHFEPEVSIQVFGRYFQNQIELVRNLALSLPAGMIVLVKEHPRSVGFRPLGYYRKLLEIPNVLLADPVLSTHFLIRYAALVAVISGSTGLEAAICGRPVITFGTPTYNALPDAMVRRVDALQQLPGLIADMLATHQTDDDALTRFLAAHVAGAVPVDLYSVLLAKKGRHSEGREHLSVEQRRSEDYTKLARYCLRRIDDATKAVVSDG